MLVRVTDGVLGLCLIARCRSSLYRNTFIPFSVSLWNDLADCIQWCRTSGFKRGPILFYWPARSFYLLLFSLSCHPFYIVWYCVVGVFGLILYKSLSGSFALPSHLNSNSTIECSTTLTWRACISLKYEHPIKVRTPQWNSHIAVKCAHPSEKRTPNWSAQSPVKCAHPSEKRTSNWIAQNPSEVRPSQWSAHMPVRCACAVSSAARAQPVQHN